MASKLLLVLSICGLLYLSGFAEAIKCYSCEEECTGNNEKEEECPAEADSCGIVKTSDGIGKGCAQKDEFEGFDCIQGKLGQSGDCIKGTVSDIDKYAVECGVEARLPNRKLDVRNAFIGKKTGKKTVQVKQGGDEYIEVCFCTKNLCNAAMGQIAGLGVVIASSMILLTTKGLFY